MHPAFSVIFFTVISGAGYGLLFLLGLGLIVDPSFIARNEVLLILALGAGAAAAGLTASLFHLGQPQRAWRALSQWRSSWLSREGVCALASFVPVCALAALIWRGADAGLVRTCALALAALAAATVYCTAQIYASLKTIRAWHNVYAMPVYFLCGLVCGAAWLLVLLGVSALPDTAVRSAVAMLFALLACACMIGKRAYWHFLDAPAHTATIESATGLGRFGDVRSAEPPHTEENYLIREMGFVLARKHAQRLRAIALTLLGPLPTLFALVYIVLALQVPAIALVCAILAALSASAGCFVERWLFFAEAKHVVMLYYGTQHV
ncbi:MAG: dimethyl sulfoxide reductase anchor subunit family protein [Rudaea sp.]